MTSGVRLREDVQVIRTLPFVGEVALFGSFASSPTDANDVDLLVILVSPGDPQSFWNLPLSIPVVAVTRNGYQGPTTPRKEFGFHLTLVDAQNQGGFVDAVEAHGGRLTSVR